MTDFEIRNAQIDDLNQIMDIENNSFHSPWKYEDIKREIEDNKFANVWVIDYNGIIAGFVDYWQTFDSGTICQIAVKKEFRKQGLASILLSEVLDDCYAKKIQSLTLEVRVSNEAAIALYKKHGFEKVLIKPHFYVDGEDAIYMIRKVVI